MKLITVATRVRGLPVLSALGLCVVLAGELSAQEMSIPVEGQVSLFLRILAFDRSLADRAGDEIVFGIVYQSRVRASLNAKDAVMATVNQNTRIDGLPVRCVPIEVANRAQLRVAIIQHGIDVLYIAPLRAVSIEMISAISQEQRVLTLTGVADYVSRGVTVGIGSQGEKPVILINLAVAKTAGAELSSELLKLARIVENR